MSIHRSTYTPNENLDRELASLGYAAVTGWPDQRPITPSLVRSRLRPPDDERPTVLLTARSPSRRLIAAAALRFPGGRHGVGRLWGPLVHPTQRRRGLGRQLLDEITDVIEAEQPAVRVTTAEIPAARTHAAAFYQSAGWRRTGSALLLKATLGPAVGEADDHAAGIRPLRPGEDLTADLAALYAAVRPETDSATVAATFHRWSADERFSPDCLLLAHGLDSQLLGAALVYPLAHTDRAEAAEALIADLLVSPDAQDSDLLRGRLVRSAMAAGRRHDAAVGRAVIDANDTDTAAALGVHGFAVVDQLHYFAPPTNVGLQLAAHSTSISGGAGTGEVSPEEAAELALLDPVRPTDGSSGFRSR